MQQWNLFPSHHGTQTTEATANPALQMAGKFVQTVPLYVAVMLRYEHGEQTEAPESLQVPPVHAAQVVRPGMAAYVPAGHGRHAVRLKTKDPALQTNEQAALVPLPMKVVYGDWFGHEVHAVAFPRA